MAPADEYFGRLKLSPFGIRHQIFSLKDDLHHARLQPDSIAHDASFTDDALHDWFARFPQDPWLPATAWNLATLYEELPGPDAQTKAIATLKFVRDSFTNTPYAVYASHDLSRGVGERPWPHWAHAQHVAQAAPPSPHASPSPHSSSTPHPSPTARKPEPTQSPFAVHTPGDPASLTAAIRAQSDLAAAETLEKRFWALSNNGNDAAYTRDAWELAALYERLPGEDARVHAIHMLAFLVDRYPNVVYGRWAMRDLERGVGAR